jgi:acetolactate synthase-1/2/3 large subunit
MPNGAQALMKTLADAGVTVCFTNPGTSEMHFVAALDDEPRMRAVLALFEGVATGAADGYARMADRPAATLLHLGCGLGNGLANLHNARKGKVPIVNIVGDHATYHVPLDAQLQSDIETVARNVSPEFVRTSRTTADLCRDAVDAVVAARGLPGRVATLILPADVSWGDGGTPCPPPPEPAPASADAATVEAIARVLSSGGKTALLLGGQRCASRRCSRHPALPRRPARSCCPKCSDAPRTRRRASADRTHRLSGRTRGRATGRARPPDPRRREIAGVVLRLSGQDQRSGARGLHRPHVVDAGPGRRRPVSPHWRVHSVPRRRRLPCSRPQRPGRPRGRLTAEKVCKAVGHLLPENAIIVDEAITSGLMLPVMTAGARRMI